MSKKKEQQPLATDNQVRRDAVAQAMARLDGAYDSLFKAVGDLSVITLPYFPAMEKTQEALSAIDVARAHVRELLKRMP